MKIRPVGAEMFHAERQRIDRRDEIDSRFSQKLRKATKNAFRVKNARSFFNIQPRRGTSG